MFRLCLLVLLVPVLAVAEETEGARIEYAGGTMASLPQGSGGRMDLSRGDALRIRVRDSLLEIPYASINLLEYGQKVDRRLVESIVISPLLLLAKRRKHFLTLGFTGADGRQQALVFQVHKGAVRAVLAGLEARTGRRVEYQDAEARKAGKG
ncbi:MAG: hypothetical protein IT158_04685 [Bryobacterales bacterium]|nr:hypothetical protein [Bryobacterales bacterium]